jgi:ubiquitin-activating enzyme E1
MAAPSSAGAPVAAIDEQLYSRQLFVMGHAAQSRMQASNVLVIGLRGVGVEVAKNLVLMGVKSVALLDDEPAVPADLSANVRLPERRIVAHTWLAICPAPALSDHHADY